MADYFAEKQARDDEFGRRLAERNKAIANRPDKKQPRPNPDLNLGQKDVNRKLSITTTNTNPPLRPGAHGMLPVGKKSGTTSPTPGASAASGVRVRDKGDNTRVIAAQTAKSTPRPTTGKPKSKPKGSVGAASNRDLPGKTTITYKPGKPRDLTALRAASKASLADSKAAAAARSNGPGGGADRVLAYQRGQKPRRLVGGNK